MPSILFIHRSVGRNLIADGHLYHLVREAGKPFDLSDFDQNSGLLQTAHSMKKVDWKLPGGDTTPANYARLFSEENNRNQEATLKSILNYDIIVIKSCYPNSNLASEADLQNAQASYQKITQFFHKLPNKKLVIVTSPPLVPLKTNARNASRARRLATWLAQTGFAPNVFVFDLFNELAAPEGQKQANMLRRSYRRWLPFDAHPNVLASGTIAPKLFGYLKSVSLKSIKRTE